MLSKSAVRTRALLALALMVGFYVLALAIAGGLLWVPVLEWRAGTLHLKLDLIALIAGATILWAIFPRRERFEVPGPRLTAEGQPELFAEIARVAQQTGQRPPDEVYLVPDVNAWVMERGGLLGFGRKRVMGLGLALMRLLTVSQFRAVLAHEYGHDHGGDTRLGTWLFGARASMTRTIQSLSAQSSWLHYPFLWYGNAFLRVTHALSRQQEFVADALAARTVSPAALEGGLKRVHAGGMMFGSYWSGELVPALNAGVRPPIADGFARFLQAPKLAAFLDEHLQGALSGTERPDPLDTHPPLHQRLSSIAALTPGEATPDDREALTLLRDPAGLERELLRSLAGDGAGQLESADWADVGERVYRKLWGEVTREHADALAPLTPRDLATDLRVPERRNALMVSLRAHPDAEGEAKLAFLLAAAVGTLLGGAGWRYVTAPGEPVLLEGGAQTFDPRAFALACLEGPEAAAPFLTVLEAAGVADRPLSAGGTA